MLRSLLKLIIIPPLVVAAVVLVIIGLTDPNLVITIGVRLMTPIIVVGVFVFILGRLYSSI
jgi:hypothetical protein